MNILIQNLPYIIASALGVVVWLIRLEGVVKANKQKAEDQAASIILQMKAELSTRDARIEAVKEETAHLTRMGEDIKGTLNPLLQKVAGMDSKLDILIDHFQKNKI